MRWLLAFLLFAPASRAAELARPAAPAALPVFADLPSLDLTLTPPRLETLRQILTEDKGLSAESFRAYVESDPAAAARALDEQRKGSKAARLAMTEMYNGMRRVAVRGGLPLAERAALAEILARRYAA